MLEAQPTYVDVIARGARRLARRLPPHIDVRDLMQAAWLRLLQRNPSGDDARGREHNAAHLASHSRGAMLDELRRMDHMPRRTPENERVALVSIHEVGEDEVVDGFATPEQRVERVESLRVLNAAVCELPDPLRMVVLHQMADVPAQSTAATLGVSASRVSQLRAEAVRMLRIRLSRPFGIRPDR